MATSVFESEKYRTLLDDLREAPSARLKSSAIELFAYKHKLEKSKVVDHLLANEAGIFDRDTISLIISDASPPAPRQPPASQREPQGERSSAEYAQRPAVRGSFHAVSEGVSSATAADVQARQRDLLQGYGKAATAAELEKLRGAADPFEATDAKAIIAGGGAPLEELRRKYKLWQQANADPPKPPKDAKPARAAAPTPPRLQFSAWLVTKQKAGGPLAVSAFAEVSKKLADDSTALDAIGNVLDKAVYARGDERLELDDLVMLDAEDPRLKIWSSYDMTATALDLFMESTVKREVFLAPLSSQSEALRAIKDHLGSSPKGKLGASSKAARQDVKREHRIDADGAGPKRAKHANNLYVKWCKSQNLFLSDDGKVDTAQAAAEWVKMEKSGQARWLHEQDLLGELTEATQSSYLTALGQMGHKGDALNEENGLDEGVPPVSCWWKFTPTRDTACVRCPT
jgi:hypothetical protein